MASAIIGLVGATLGTLATLLGTTLSERRQGRREDRTWRRDQLSAAYEGAFRSLARAASYRFRLILPPTFFRSGDPEFLQEWFDDLVEAQYRLRVLISHCNRPGGGTHLPMAVERLDEALAALSARKFEKTADVTDEANELIATCARLDIGRDAMPLSPSSQAGDEPRAVSRSS